MIQYDGGVFAIIVSTGIKSKGSAVDIINLDLRLIHQIRLVILVLSVIAILSVWFFYDACGHHHYILLVSYSRVGKVEFLNRLSTREGFFIILYLSK